MAARSRREAIAKLKDETISKIFSFTSTLYLKQQANILRCFSSLKFENSLFSNKLFRCIFHSEGKVYTAENDHDIRSNISSKHKKTGTI